MVVKKPKNVVSNSNPAGEEIVDDTNDLIYESQSKKYYAVIRHPN